MSSKRILVTVSIIATALLVAGCGPKQDAPKDGHAGHDATATNAASALAQKQEWTCSMHPQIRMPAPGKCPICGMDLVPVAPSDRDRPSSNVAPLRLTVRLLAAMPVMCAACGPGGG